MIIKASRERRPNSGDLFEISDAGTHHPLQAAEVLQERASFRGPKTGNSLEHRLVVAPCAFATVSANGETMCLVADSLHQTRRRRVRFGNVRLLLAINEEPLLTGLAVRSLGDTNQHQVTEPQRLQLPVHLVDLTEAAIDQEQVRRRNLPIADAV